MSQTFTRRTSYGANSPRVGTRGVRTRTRLLEAAQRCFAARGYHATAVEDIAAAANTSRATLYQYFESKEAILVELLSAVGRDV